MPAPERDHNHASQRACAGRVTVRKRAGAESPPHQTQKLETTSHAQRRSGRCQPEDREGANEPRGGGGRGHHDRSGRHHAVLMVGEQAEQAAGHVAHVPGRGALKDRRRWVPGSEHDLCRSDPGRQTDDRHRHEPGDAGPAIGLAAPDGRDDGQSEHSGGQRQPRVEPGQRGESHAGRGQLPERHRRVANQACEQPQGRSHRRRCGSVGVDRRRM